MISDQSPLTPANPPLKSKGPLVLAFSIGSCSYWKLRAGDYRVVFRVDGDEILILGIFHRKEVYPLMERRK